MSGLELAGVVARCRFENADEGRNGGPLQQSFAIYDIEDDLEATRKALAVNFLGPHTPCPTHSIVIKRLVVRLSVSGSLPIRMALWTESAVNVFHLNCTPTGGGMWPLRNSTVKQVTVVDGGRERVRRSGLQRSVGCESISLRRSAQRDIERDQSHPVHGRIYGTGLEQGGHSPMLGV